LAKIAEINDHNIDPRLDEEKSKNDSLVDQLLVLVFALLDDVLQLEQLLQVDCLLLQKRLDLGSIL
jgi:hypothetical protein